MQTYEYQGPDGPVQIPLTHHELLEAFPTQSGGLAASVAAYLSAHAPPAPFSSPEPGPAPVESDEIPDISIEE